MNRTDPHVIQWGSLVRALVYPVQFEKNPIDFVDRVVALTQKRHFHELSLEAHVELIAAALESDEELAKLLPQRHSEQTIRSFLAAVRHRFEQLIAEGPKHGS